MPSPSGPLAAPLAFCPVYQVLVWGGRRLARWRGDLPDGPIGESWELADHARGMSVVAAGPLAGRSLRELTQDHGAALVGEGFRGGAFPLMVKLIDATDTLSVQVHPDDAIAQALGLGDNGKTECWLLVGDTGFLYQGTRPGIDRAAFERTLAEGRLEEALNRFVVGRGDFFFLDARTVHALGAGCLLFEVQQTSDVTFRVYDWGRAGLDGKPRPLHVRESLETIDFSRGGFGPVRTAWQPLPEGGEARRLADCRHFTVEERRLRASGTTGGGAAACTIVSCTDGEGTLATAGGHLRIGTMQTALVPAAAGPWTFTPTAGGSAGLMVSSPRLT